MKRKKKRRFSKWLLIVLIPKLIGLILVISFNVWAFNNKGVIEKQSYRLMWSGAKTEVKKLWEEKKPKFQCKYCNKSGFWHCLKHERVIRELKANWNGR